MSKTVRMFSLLLELSQQPGISVKDLARSLNITERSAYRYLNELKKQGFRLRHAEDPEAYQRKHILTPLTFTSDEALALNAACKSLLYQNGLPVSKHLKSALHKVEGAVRSVEDKRAYFSLRSHFTVISECRRDLSAWGEIFEKVMEAIRLNQTLELIYDSYSSGKTTERKIDPYSFFWKNGNCYLTAFCHTRKRFCNFRLDRVKSIIKIAGNFTRDNDFQLNKHLGPSFGVWCGTGEITIRFLVYYPASRLFRENCYHPSQRIEEAENGNIICTFTIYDTPEIKSWLMSWGSMVEVLEPEGLRAAIIDEFKCCLEKYM